MVAKFRGVKFKTDFNGFLHPTSLLDSRESLNEVSEWLGFDSTQLYLDALEVEKEKIFDRIKPRRRIR